MKATMEGVRDVDPDLFAAVWRKSSRSGGNNGACVELANVGAVRDSKNPTGPALHAGHLDN